MTGIHKPFSDWIARVGPSGTYAINDGAERSDARAMAMFDSGWARLGVVLSNRVALGLRNAASGETVIELDDYGFPLLIEGAAVALLSRLEDQWPQVELTEVDLAELRSMSRELRYLVLHRLEREGTPAPEWFHVLPWEPVAELAEAVSRMLDGADPEPLSGDADDLGHWVTPALSGVTGPLEQLHDGLAVGSRGQTLAGATALCAGVAGADPLRLPEHVRESLAQVLRRLAALNPFLRHSADVAVAQVAPGHGPASRFTVRLSSTLPKAATRDDLRSVVTDLDDGGPLGVRAEVTAGGRLRLTAEVAIEDSPARSQLVADYLAVVVPVLVRTEGAVTRYWIPLEVRRRWMSGTVAIAAPLGEFEVEADQPPVGGWGLTGVPVVELLASIRATNQAGVRVWREVADRCPDGHPLHRALRQADEGPAR
jgi:hypothetical protein